MSKAKVTESAQRVKNAKVITDHSLSETIRMALIAHADLLYNKVKSNKSKTEDLTKCQLKNKCVSMDVLDKQKDVLNFVLKTFKDSQNMTLPQLKKAFATLKKKGEQAAKACDVYSVMKCTMSNCEKQVKASISKKK